MNSIRFLLVSLSVVLMNNSKTSLILKSNSSKCPPVVLIPIGECLNPLHASHSKISLSAFSKSASSRDEPKCKWIVNTISNNEAKKSLQKCVLDCSFGLCVKPKELYVGDGDGMCGHENNNNKYGEELLLSQQTRTKFIIKGLKRKIL